MNVDPNSVNAQEEHPDVEEISALAEGVLPGDRADVVRAHIADCSLCATVDDSLDQIKDLLSELPAPAGMPDDVAERIEAALVSETLSTRRGESGAAGRAPSEGGIPARAGADPPAHLGKGRPVGASTCDGGIPAARRGTKDAARPAPSGSTIAPTKGPARGVSSGPGRGGRFRRHRRWSLTLLATVCGAAVFGFGTFLVNTEQTPQDGGVAESTSEQGATAERQTASGPVYTESNVESLARNLLTETRRDASTRKTEDRGSEDTQSPMIAPRGGESGPAATPLPRCVLDATGRVSETPLATGVGQYRGTPVGVVVLPERSDSQRARVYLVDSRCGSTASKDPGTVLLERTVFRR